MRIMGLAKAFLFLFLLTVYITNAKAQDTFGPICDDVTVTCAPTATPSETPTPTELPPGYPTPTPSDTPTPTPTPTLTPTETPTPTLLAGKGGLPDSPTPAELLQAGVSDKLYLTLLFSGTIVIVGLIGHFGLKRGLSPYESPSSNK